MGNIRCLTTWDTEEGWPGIMNCKECRRKHSWLNLRYTPFVSVAVTSVRIAGMWSELLWSQSLCWLVFVMQLFVLHSITFRICQPITSFFFFNCFECSSSLIWCIVLLRLERQRLFPENLGGIANFTYSSHILQDFKWLDCTACSENTRTNNSK